MSARADPAESMKWDWGKSKPEWAENVGSVLVVRQDQRDISPQVVEAFVDFYTEKIKPYFFRTKAIPDPKSIVTMTRQRVVDVYIKKGYFEPYFEDGKRQRATADPSWVHVVSPYRWIMCGKASIPSGCLS